MDWESKAVKEIVTRALEEDIGTGDVTTDPLISPDFSCKAVITMKEKGVIAGFPLVSLLYKVLDEKVVLHPLLNDGDYADGPKDIAQMEGPARGIVKGERVALNFLQRLSGIATLTREFVERVEGTGVTILDTRKTTPNLRVLEKYAVHVGGGENYRSGLFDMVMVKDNHIAAVGGIKKAIILLRKKMNRDLMVVVETKNLEEIKEALSCSVDRIMLDNMSINEIKEAVAFVQGKVPLEASGNMTLEKVREVAETGVDYISVGSLTTRFRAIDMSLNIIDYEGIS
jgi:nicotinate-nucleotide pyrophosphorylase (carboxylating)